MINLALALHGERFNIPHLSCPKQRNPPKYDRHLMAKALKTAMKMQLVYDLPSLYNIR
jgi:hypothetical protein